MRESGRRVLISGASGGLGRELTDLALAQGHEVIGLVRPQPLAEVLEIPSAHASRLTLLSVDLTDPSQLLEHSGQLAAVDVLINNAGFAKPSPVEQAQQVEGVFAVNYVAAVTLMQQVLPGMRQRQWGMIINVSSLSAHIGLVGDGVYSASKAALERTAESLRSEVAPFGIRVVNAVPGAIATPMQQKMRDTISLADQSPYAALMARIADSCETHGAQPRAIAREILALMDQPDPPLTVPVGDQARTVMKSMGMMTEQRRAQLISEFSLAQWWRQQGSEPPDC